MTDHMERIGNEVKPSHAEKLAIHVTPAAFVELTVGTRRLIKQVDHARGLHILVDQDSGQHFSVSSKALDEYGIGGK